MKRLLLIPLVLFLACEKLEITSQVAVQLLYDKNYIFLDVRTESEHQAKAIPNTTCIPVQELTNRLNEIEKFKDKNIILYCRSGNRSKTATKILIENDFKALNLIGGIKEWNGPIASGK